MTESHPATAEIRFVAIVNSPGSTVATGRWITVLRRECEPAQNIVIAIPCRGLSQLVCTSSELTSVYPSIVVTIAFGALA